MTVTASDPNLEILLNHLAASRGFDFTAYKRSTLARRIAVRMAAVHCDDYGAYLDYLQVDPEEFGRLFNTILINVTSFFRDAAAWEYLRDHVLPRVVDQRREGEPIRVWTAACASGEETYSVAMLLAEALGAEDAARRVKIYATDIDDEALSVARHAVYTAKQLESIPPDLREKYLEPVAGRYQVKKEIRRLAIFGRHDLLQDAPISRVDLLICRNVLMYFNSESQARILERFGFALSDGGFLFLGKAETLLSRSVVVTPEDAKLRIFRKLPGARNVIRGNAADPNPGRPAPATGPALELAFQRGLAAQLLVDANGTLLFANEAARRLFGISQIDNGKAIKDLELSYRPVELRSRVEEAITEGNTSVVRDIPWPANGGSTLWYELAIIPLAGADGRRLAVNCVFTDVTQQKLLQREMDASRSELAATYEELQSANEELETTNEELQSTIEELETTNEELQSTNEELETINEELQSTNEELEQVNAGMEEQAGELNRANTFLESILSSIRAGVVVLSQNLEVQIWNAEAEDQWGLRREEVRGRYFLGLDIGLPAENLIQPIRDCLNAASNHVEREVLVEATNRRGRSVQCRVRCTPLLEDDHRVAGVILLIDDNPVGSSREAAAT
ncbi:MAG: PAS domain-containing protein [Dehalococcoidia bacterium]|nr:PAS domain-containing protein [Dehalococcoidia bacterium]